jgi:DNA-binding NtrC family response regulator
METRSQLVGVSKAIRDIELEIESAGRTDAKVLLTGESGVGKEVVAHRIHQASRRRFSTFVPINCAGVPDTLLESELFGHIRGSFTDAHRDKKGWLFQAHGGTVFLDEVGEMSVRMQAVLLRFLETGELQRVGAEHGGATANVRVIAATNRNLLAQVAEKNFRDDLYYRLNVIHIAIPPLRNRIEDIRPLVNFFVRASCDTHRLTVPRVLDETMARLETYAWPGNVRELKNVVERLVIRARHDVIPPTDLPREIQLNAAAPTTSLGTPVASGPDKLYDRMAIEGESFWSVVYEPFMARDLTRDDLRAVISKGLEQTRGSYKLLLELFNVPPNDYKKLLAFLRKHQCHMPFQKFRSISVGPESLSVARRVIHDERLVNAR